MSNCLRGGSGALFAEKLAGRVLSFDGAVAKHRARIVTARQAAGAPIEGFDGLIATTAADFGLATCEAGGCPPMA